MGRAGVTAALPFEMALHGPAAGLRPGGPHLFEEATTYGDPVRIEICVFCRRERTSPLPHDCPEYHPTLGP